MNANSQTISNDRHLQSSNQTTPNSLPGLSVKQKLELYQIIAFANEGNVKGVVDRATALLKAAKEQPQIADDSTSLLRQMSVEEILRLACQSLVTNSGNAAQAIV